MKTVNVTDAADIQKRRVQKAGEAMQRAFKNIENGTSRWIEGAELDDWFAKIEGGNE